MSQEVPKSTNRNLKSSRITLTVKIKRKSSVWIVFSNHISQIENRLCRVLIVSDIQHVKIGFVPKNICNLPPDCQMRCWMKTQCSGSSGLLVINK